MDDLQQAAVPGTGDVMAIVADCWWRCAYAGRAGAWPLAAYYGRRVRGLQRRLSVIKPKHALRLERFEREILEPLLAACAARDRAAFDRLYAAGTDLANAMHVETGHGYLRWVLPDEPPKDLVLTREP